MSMKFLDGYDRLSDGTIALRLTEKNLGNKEIQPFYYYDILASNGELAGKISIRIGDNTHSYYNGHIGYEIDEAHRGQAYALRACKLVLPVASAYGMKRLYLTCGISNAASRKTIERLGANLTEITDIPKSCFFWRPGIERYCIHRLEI